MRVREKDLLATGKQSLIEALYEPFILHPPKSEGMGAKAERA